MLYRHDTSAGKQPYYFIRRDEQSITIAEQGDEWKEIETSERLKSCIIAGRTILSGDVHDRMSGRPHGSLPRFYRSRRTP
jgi:hypothetical protein